MRLSSSWRARRARLAVNLEIPSSNPERSGLTSSAAAVGVGARRSATKSAIVKSVSCPMPVTTGTGHARIARATISSLKAHKSSTLPPPRTSNMTSHPPSRPAVLSAEPCAPHGFDIELEIAAGFVQADERLHLDLHAVARRPLEILLALPEHDAAHLGVLVLQDEIGVSRLGNGEVGYLAGDPKQGI